MSLTTLTVSTHNPTKYTLHDHETGDVWRGTNEGHWRQAARVEENGHDTLIQKLRGRAAFLRDMGCVKSPQLIEQAANALEATLPDQPAITSSVSPQMGDARACTPTLAQPAKGLAGEVVAMRDAVGECRDGIQARIAEMQVARLRYVEREESQSEPALFCAAVDEDESGPSLLTFAALGIGALGLWAGIGYVTWWLVGVFLGVHA